MTVVPVREKEMQSCCISLICKNGGCSAEVACGMSVAERVHAQREKGLGTELEAPERPLLADGAWRRMAGCQRRAQLAERVVSWLI